MRIARNVQNSAPRKSNSSCSTWTASSRTAKIWIFPAPAGSQQSILEQANQHRGEGGFGFQSASLIEAKGFHAHDGTAISLARLAGLKTGVITKRYRRPSPFAPAI